MKTLGKASVLTKRTVDGPIQDGGLFPQDRQYPVA